MLIDRVKLPAPRRGDILAVPVTGAYTLSMSSTYNAVPGPRPCSSPTARPADPPARDDRRPARARSLSLFPQLAQTRTPCSGRVWGGAGWSPGGVGRGPWRAEAEAESRSEPRPSDGPASERRPQQARGRGSRASLTCGVTVSASGAAPNEARTRSVGRVAVQRRALARDAAGGRGSAARSPPAAAPGRTRRRRRARSTRSSACRRGR